MHGRRPRRLARDYAVTMLPSVASLRTLRSLPPGPGGRKAYAGFGDPFFSPEQAAEAGSPASGTAEVAALTSIGLQTRGLPVRLRAAPRTSDLDSAQLARLPRLPETVEHDIAAFVERTGADEIMITCNIHDHAKRLRSFELVAKMMYAGHAASPQ